MRPYRATLAVAVISCLLMTTGCKDDEPTHPHSKTTASSSHAPEDTQSDNPESRDRYVSAENQVPQNEAAKPNDGLREVYRSILANPAQVPHGFSSDVLKPSGKYFYTLADVDGDGLPEMLLEIGSERDGLDEISTIATIMGTSTPGHVVIDPERFISGAATSGGFRASLFGPMPGHTGLAQLTWQSISPTADVSVYTVTGGMLIPSEKFSAPLSPLSVPGFCTPDWLPLTDSSLVDSLTPPGCKDEPAANAHGSNPPPPTEKFPTSEDNSTPTQPADPFPTTTAVGPQTLTGTVRKYTGVQLVDKLPPREDPNATYYVLDFDTAPALTCKQTYYYRTRTKPRMALVDPGWASHEGEHVTVTATPDDCFYPSDITMPATLARLILSPDSAL